METILAKLNYREGQAVYVLNQPDMFEDMLKTFTTGIPVFNELTPGLPIDFILVFVTLRSELEELAGKIAPALKGDAIFWLVYPKGTSKNYTCDFNRDTSWELMAPYNMMPVRQIAIDADWSALRFRKAEYIKSTIRKTPIGQ